MLKIALTISAVALLSTSSVMAQQRVATKACAADIKAQCARVQPGEGRIRACIKEHFKDLSEPCQAVLVKAAAIGKACGCDVGRDSGSPVSENYGPRGNEFTGRVKGVEIAIADAAEQADHLVSPVEAVRIALARQ